MLMGIMITFDLGGPINKIAMITAVIFLVPGDASQNFPIINGAAAVAVSIPAMVIILNVIFGK
jgi:fructose-specific phosphotransferase system IIC component